MRKLFKNAKGFTIAEVAASLGIIALVATVISPMVGNTNTSVSDTQTITVADSTAMPEPETLPVEAILVNVTDTATGVVTPKVVNDPNATSTTISGLDPQGNYTVEVAKKSQAGVSPKATAKVNYTKVGEKTVTLSEPVLEVEAASTTVAEEVSTNTVVTGYEQKLVGYQKKLVGYQKKVVGYEKKTISAPAYIQTTASLAVRQVTKTRQVRIAPFERTVTKSRQKYVAPYTYTYSCTKSESYSYACGTNPTYSYACGSTSYTYACGTTSYTYSCTKSKTKYCYSPSRGSYACGTTYYSSTCTGSKTKYCTGSQTKYCTGGGGTKYCTGTRNVSSTCTGSGGGYYTTENYTETEAVYNYKTETYTENEQYTVSNSAPAAYGTCAANGTVGSWTGVTYSCTDTTKAKTVDDTSKPIYADDTSKPIMVDDTSKPIYGNDLSKPIEDVQVSKSSAACPAGFSESSSTAYKTVSYRDGKNGWATKQIPYTVKSCVRAEQWGTRYWNEQRDVKKAVTTAKEVTAPARQLVLEVSGNPIRSWNWATGTVAAVGTGATGFAKGDTVSFRYGQVFTFDGKKYIKVPAQSFLVKK